MVTGAPAKLRERRAELTPMLSQYVDLAEEYDDCLLLFRVGDFYKAFCETAEAVARVCELTLIEREDSTGTYAACGIPIENPSSYLERLLAADYRLAIADQVEDPEETTGLVERAVTRIVTPGTVVDEELLATGSSNYLACVVTEDAAGEGGESVEREESLNRGAPKQTDSERYGLAWVDVSTGECAVTSGSRAAISEEVTRLAPAEFLSGDRVAIEPPGDPAHTPVEPAATGLATAGETVARYTTPDRFEPAECRALGGLLRYAEYTQGDDGPLSHVTSLRQYDPRRSLRLDRAALRGLELFESREPSGRTLIEEIDETHSALGRRRLRAWLRRPSVDPAEIRSRHDAVAALVESPLVRATLADAFEAVYDLQRLVGRVARERADARDLRSLHATLAAIPELREATADVEPLAGLREQLQPLGELRAEIDAAIVPDPPTELTDGGVIRDGYDETLDDLRATAREGREWVAELAQTQRDRTGIDTLEVGYNQVHGYYIEVTNGQLEKVPDDYTRRQTLKNAERFYTPELKRREDEILGAEERAESREYEVFSRVRARVADATDRLQSVADAVARLDALLGLATVAVDRDYCRPTVGTDAIEIRRGRHPVVERTESAFVANDAELPAGSCTLLTGPNMSGKSTYMRQIALTCLLAQAGSFVPADRAELPVVDRLFTRVGASDDIAGGQSTFMREMAELTDILHDATPDSLVLLDEVGRGTSTTDGMAIARAAVEYLHDELQATTVFATHYHDLTGLADRFERVRNRHFTASQADGGVTFLHQLREGAASSSYGIEVARMAGVPAPVVTRADELVDHSGGPADAADELADDADEPTDTTDGLAEAASEPTDGADKPTDTTDEPTDGTDRPQGDDSVAETDQPTAEPADSNGTAPTAPDSGGQPTAELEDAAATGERSEAASAVLRQLEELTVAETTPMEALQTLHALQRRLEGGES